MTYTCVASNKLKAGIYDFINRITVDLPALSLKEVHSFRHSIDGKTYLLTGIHVGQGAIQVEHCDMILEDGVG